MRKVLVGVLFVLAVGCGGDPKIVSVTLNPTTVQAGGTTKMTVVLENFDTGAGHDEHGLLRRALRETHGEAGEESDGHIHVYLDNVMSNPLVQTSSTTFDVLIPQATMAGAHNLITRLHNHDHLIIEPEVSVTSALTVQ